MIWKSIPNTSICIQIVWLFYAVQYVWLLFLYYTNILSILSSVDAAAYRSSSVANSVAASAALSYSAGFFSHHTQTMGLLSRASYYPQSTEQTASTPASPYSTHHSPVATGYHQASPVSPASSDPLEQQRGTPHDSLSKSSSLDRPTVVSSL